MKKSYKLIGGLIGGILSVLLFLASDFIFPVCSSGCPNISNRLAAILPIAWALREILLAYFIGGFIIGALIGWILGKVKNRNRIVPQ